MYCFRGEYLQFRTIDHSYVESLVAKGRITPELAQFHPRRNILMTSLGGGETPQIDYGDTEDLRAGDSFILCSDGLWGYFSDTELGASLSTHSARAASDLLISRARTRARNEGDNLSLVVIKLMAAPERTLRNPGAVPVTG